MKYMKNQVKFSEFEDKGNNWLLGEAEIEGRKLWVVMKRFEEPSEFGISDGRISKLSIGYRDGRDYERHEWALNYDRGWDVHWRKCSKPVQAVYRAVLERWN